MAELVARIRADTTQFDAGLRRVQNSVQTAATEIDSAGVSTRRFVAELGRITAQATGFRSFGMAINAITNALDGASGGVTRFVGVAAKTAGWIGLIEAVRQLAETFMDLRAAMLEVEKAQESLGKTVDRSVLGRLREFASLWVQGVRGMLGKPMEFGIAAPALVPTEDDLRANRARFAARLFEQLQPPSIRDLFIRWVTEQLEMGQRVTEDAARAWLAEKEGERRRATDRTVAPFDLGDTLARIGGFVGGANNTMTEAAVVTARNTTRMVHLLERLPMTTGSGVIVP